MNLTPLSPSETKKFQNYIYDFWKEFFETGTKEEVIAKRPDLQQGPKFYTQRDGNFWLMKDQDGKIFAMVGVHKILFTEGEEKISVGFLRRFFVSKEYRSHGLGSKMLEHVENFCQEKNWKYLMFGVDESMGKVKKFYTAHGYAEFSKNIPQEILDDNDEWYFRKEL